MRATLLASADTSLQIFINGKNIASEVDLVTENFGPPHGKVVLENEVNTNGGTSF